MAPASKEVKTGLFVDKFYPVDDIYKKRYEEVKSTDKQIRLQYLDLGYYLGADGLVKTDRASNLNSLEVRVPFLSRKLAELCFSLPGSYHDSGNVS